MKPNSNGNETAIGRPTGWRGGSRPRRERSGLARVPNPGTTVAVWIAFIVVIVVAIASATHSRPQGIAMMSPGQKAPPPSFAGIRL